MLSMLLALVLNDGTVLPITVPEWFAEIHSNAFCIYARQGDEYYTASGKAFSWALVRAERSLTSDDYLAFLQAMGKRDYHEYTMSIADSLIMRKCRDQIR